MHFLFECLLVRVLWEFCGLIVLKNDLSFSNISHSLHTDEQPIIKKFSLPIDSCLLPVLKVVFSITGDMQSTANDFKENSSEHQASYFLNTTNCSDIF